jgi:ATP/maltotriose-dependent transcriptional regulator MalT
MQLPISEDDVALLEARTEGWIAGLQLAALSLRTQTNPTASAQNFTGGQRFILDYVQEEILGRLPLSVQDFLLHIAILDRMNAALCQAVTGESASQEMLEMLERNNLFVIPLDSERQWYRLHSLFRDVLLVRLQATQPSSGKRTNPLSRKRLMLLNPLAVWLLLKAVPPLLHHHLSR